MLNMPGTLTRIQTDNLSGMPNSMQRISKHVMKVQMSNSKYNLLFEKFRKQLSSMSGNMRIDKCFS